MKRLLAPLGVDDCPEIRGLAAQYAAPGKEKVMPKVPGELSVERRISAEPFG